MNPVLMLLILTIGIAMMACKTNPPVAPEQETSSAIATLVVSRSLFGDDHSFADKVYFIKIDEAEKLLGHTIFTSTYKNDQNLYLLNAEPGRYAIVGFYRLQFQNQRGVSRTNHLHYMLDLDSIKQTIFSVEANQTKIVGQLRAGSMALRSGDAAQQHYGERLAPAARGWSSFGTNLFQAMLSGHWTYRYAVQLEGVEYNEVVRTRILDGMIEDWQGTSWEGKSIRRDAR